MCEVVPMRALDEVAAAVRLAADRWPRPVLSAFGIAEQFAGPVTPGQWAAIQQALAVELPPLEFVQGHWFLPDGLETIWDLVERAAEAHPDWEFPADRTVAAWRNAQVFAGVRAALADALGFDPSEVARESTFRELLR